MKKRTLYVIFWCVVILFTLYAMHHVGRWVDQGSSNPRKVYREVGTDTLTLVFNGINAGIEAFMYTLYGLMVFLMVGACIMAFYYSCRIVGFLIKKLFWCIVDYIRYGKEETNEVSLSGE
jgi:nucleoside permease NupC